MLDLPLDDRGLVPSGECEQRRQFVSVTNGRRRTILDIIDSTPGTNETTLGELASDIERHERNSHPDADVSKRQLLTSLHHVHLPVLDSAGLIEYHPESKRIQRPPERLSN